MNKACFISYIVTVQTNIWIFYSLEKTSKWYGSPRIVVLSPLIGSPHRWPRSVVLNKLFHGATGRLFSRKINANIIWNIRWISLYHRQVWTFESALQNPISHFVIHNQILFVSWDFYLIQSSSNANIRYHTVTQISIPMQPKRVKRSTEYPAPLVDDRINSIRLGLNCK